MLSFRRYEIRLMLRTFGLHRLPSGMQRFSTSGHPEALGACYVASWQLQRLDTLTN